MTFRQVILGTVAASGILLAAQTFTSGGFTPVPPAAAATNVSININVGTFYDRLEPYGNWVSYEDGYVWIPQRVDREWRPYTRGRWAYTRQYGWLWVSNERFGWATYHYGRWGYSRDIGWYWVPGHRWAPAWVAWHRGGREVAWAPLPPRHGDDVEVSITIGDVPDYYWQAVPVSAFLSIDLSNKVIRDREHVRTIVQQGAPETVRIENNIVINNVIEVNYIEKETKSKVKIFEEKPVSSPEAVGKSDANSVAIFNPDVKDAADAKPKKTRKVEEVATERKAKGIQPEDVPSNQTAPAQTLDKNGKPTTTTEQPAAATQEPATGKAAPDAPVAKQDKSSTDTSQPADLNTPKVDAQGNAKKSKETQPTASPPATAAAPTVEPPVTKPKKDKAAVSQPADTGNTTADAPAGKSKKKKRVDAAAPADTAAPSGTRQKVDTQQNSQQPIGQKKNRKKKEDTGASGQQPLNNNAAAPANAQAPQVEGKKKKKNAEPAVNNNGQGTAACDPNVQACPPAN
jgi:hypothetical protein